MIQLERCPTYILISIAPNFYGDIEAYKRQVEEVRINKFLKGAKL